MKITGAASTPLTSIEDACDELLELVPDSILSTTEVLSLPMQSCSSFVQPCDDENQVVGEEEVELDDFLMDAENWL